MKKVMVFIIIVLILIITGCGKENTTAIDSSKIKVVTTLFPQYDFVRVIGDEFVDVSILLPPGVEAHSYEPTPRDIIDIEKADLFIYTGEFMEPWVEKVLNSISNPDLVIVDVSEGLDLSEHKLHEDEHEDEQDLEHSHGSFDPHIWLDPEYVIHIINQVKDGLILVDNSHESTYVENTKIYLEKIKSMNKDFEDVVNKATSKTILVGGHFAFGYLAERYGLEYISVYKGFSPDAEPTSKRVAELIDLVRELDLKYIYHEELVDPKVAKIIADETGAELLLLHAAHNLSKSEYDSGLTFQEIIEMNYKNLTLGLRFDE